MSGWFDSSRLTGADISRSIQLAKDQRGGRIEIQTLFRSAMFILRSRAPISGTPENDPIRLFSFKRDAYPVIDLLLPFCDRKNYKAPHSQCREEMQRWERNRITSTVNFGAGEMVWTDVLPPREYRPVGKPTGKPFSRRNHVVANSRRKRGQEATLRTGVKT